MFGKSIRIERIMDRKTGNCVIVPMDHGISAGPIEGLIDMKKTVDDVANGGATAVVMHKGLIRYSHRTSGHDIGLILHLSASTDIGVTKNSKVLVASVEEALKIGADAVSVHINVGAETEPEMLADLGQVAKDCNEWGMPLLVMAYPRGPKIENSYDPQAVAHAARVATELGADIVKCSYTGDIDSFRDIVRGTLAPVVIAGGPKMNSDDDILQMVYDSIQAGGHGVSIGRNVFQHRNVEGGHFGHRPPRIHRRRGEEGQPELIPMDKEIWVRADVPDSKEERKNIVLSALETGIDTAIVRPGDEDFAELGKVTLRINDGGSLSDGYEIVELSTPEDQDRAMAMAGKRAGVILDSSDWTVIPLENLIAKFRNSGTKVLACASDKEQAKLYMQTLEKGVDGIVVSTDDPNAIRGFAGIVSGTSDVELTELEVLDVRNIEMGDRVCVDTVSIMVPGEGMLIGSQASCLFLIQSESEDNGYVAARPFRVNAGAVHAYVMGPEGRTRYLGELKSGEPVVLVKRDGTTRLSAVGRCKIEQRPLVLLTATDGQSKYSTILQNAETVRLVTRDGSVSVSVVKKGDRVLGRLESGGRHFGMKIDETIREI